MEIDDEEKRAIKTARRAAFRLLSIRSRLSDDLREKLRAKEIPEAAIEAAIQECQRLGFLNDEENIRSFTERSLSRGYGPLWIAAKLKKKLAIDSDRQQEAIRKFIDKKVPASSLKTTADKQKLFLKLKRRGFSSDVILSSLREHFS